MRLRPRSLAAAAVTLSAALALGACGSDDEPEVTGASVDTAASPGAGTSSPAASGTGKKAAASESPSKAGAAGADSPVAAGSTVSPEAFAEMLGSALLEGRTASLEVVVDGQHASRSTGVADFAAKPPAISLTTTVEALAGQKSKVVMVDGVVYMQMGVGASEKYAKMDLRKASGGSDFSQFDPEAAFEQLAKGFSEVAYVGEQKMDGEQMRHYRASFDPKKAKKAGATVNDVDYDAWFDQEGHVRKITMKVGKDVTSTMTYSDWGRKVTISAPPADQVVEMPSMPQSPPVSQ